MDDKSWEEWLSEDDPPDQEQPRDGTWVEGRRLDIWVAAEVDAKVTPLEVVGGRSLMVKYEVTGKPWKANLRLVARAPYDGTRWRAYLSWGPRGERDHVWSIVHGRVKYWGRPARIPGM